MFTHHINTIRQAEEETGIKSLRNLPKVVQLISGGTEFKSDTEGKAPAPVCQASCLS